MSQKGQKKPSEALKKEDILQAVLITDDFSAAFEPITFYKPASLLPLVNTTLLDYTLEFLALGGVQEVIVFCCSHTDEIKNHIKKSKWNDSLSPITISVIISEGCRSLGDAMRDLDAKGVIRSDFILLFGTTVANLHFQQALEIHRKFQKQDKGAVMTLLYKEAGPKHKSRSREDETVIAVDHTTSRIVFHQKVGQLKRINFPLETFMDHSQVEVLYNLQDTQICICSPAVPPLFSDNFDFQTRDDFVRGLLMNEEILSSTIYYHKLQGPEYASRVSNWHMYQAVSHDVIHRWTYPLVPDSPFSKQQEPYMFLRHHVYRKKDITLGMGCIPEEDVVIDEKTNVGEKTYITQSVIGKHCTIGKNVVMTNAYIWDNVIIEDGCLVSHSVVANDSVLKKGSKLEEGCILAPGVVVEEESHFKGVNLVASAVVVKDDFGHDKVVKVEKKGEKSYVIQPSYDSESEEDVSNLHDSGFYTKSDEEEYDGYSEESSGSEEISYRASPVPDDTSLFYNEVLDSLTRGFDDKLHCDNLILEINSSRYAYNVTMDEVNYHVVRAVLNLSTESSAQAYLTELQMHLKYFMPLFKNYLRNESAQKECLKAMEYTAGCRSEVLEVILKILKWLYDADVLDEDIILQWYKSPDEASTVSDVVRKKVEPFIDWLLEADEETSSEDEDEDED
ncbi:translation initiation factor eIF-2B subunit epsilon [Schistocerca cancellata]|uniref:translation initiation factor eIF-2B subunit epsilon n=1 Tax=Schistocerca cancellata TaxID=274614 RepID=UPI002118CB63|nr:translation initiation factor eIF-2B subunit epsilon [Schistocerca cancellata]